MPNIFGGINSDGSVIALDWGGTGGGSFIHNASGWHNLADVVTSAGIGMTGWSELSVLGLLEDGTPVWSSGVHNGNTQGFIMEFSAGYLDSVSAIPKPSTYATLAGAAALGLAAWRRRRSTV
jgi:MYXO-CTERM domain-containing protein